MSMPETSRCTMCGGEEPLSMSLAFLELPKERCGVCGKYAMAHPSHPEYAGDRAVRFPSIGHEYQPYVPSHASHYCGCLGWD